MRPGIEAALQGVTGLEARLHELIRVKLNYFAPNRSVLRALLRNGADPKHPLSPFSEETASIRERDIAGFQGILKGCGFRIPLDPEPAVPGVLWLFQMGVILFWVIDESAGQTRSKRLLELSSKMVTALIRFSAIPPMRPLRKTALQIIEIVKGGVHGTAGGAYLYTGAHSEVLRSGAERRGASCR